MMPVIAFNLLQSIDLLSCVCRAFARKCIVDIRANRQKCTANIEQSLALVTSLVPRIGYDRAAAIAKRAHAEGKTVREIALAEQVLPPGELDKLLTP